MFVEDAVTVGIAIVQEDVLHAVGVVFHQIVGEGFKYHVTAVGRDIGCHTRAAADLKGVISRVGGACGAQAAMAQYHEQGPKGHKGGGLNAAFHIIISRFFYLLQCLSPKERVFRC